jgi:hypothetical protein
MYVCMYVCMDGWLCASLAPERLNRFSFTDIRILSVSIIGRCLVNMIIPVSEIVAP